MKKIVVSSCILLLVFVLILPLSGRAQCKASQIQTQKYIDTGFVMEMRNQYREWYVNRNVWKLFTFSQKETAVRALAAIRHACDSYVSIEVLDGHSGELLAKYTAFGIKIYK